MLLTPAERDRLLIFTAAQLARSRRSRGLRLNVPEAIALIADTVCEAARDGARHADALAAGRAVLGPDDVLPGVVGIVTEVKVEATFDDGTRLVVVPDPIAGNQLPPSVPDPAAVAGSAASAGDVVAGDVVAGDVVAGDEVADVVTVEVMNTAAVPVSVTSHFHFFEANARLRFDRSAAYGRHLAVAAGASVRFDPWVPRTVPLVPFRGERVIVGFSGLVDGALDAPGAKEAALARAVACGYLSAGPGGAGAGGGGTAGQR